MIEVRRLIVTGAGLGHPLATFAEHRSHLDAVTACQNATGDGPDLLQVMPLLVLARAVAAYAEHLGEPRFIDLVAAAARRVHAGAPVLDLDALQKEVS